MALIGVHVTIVEPGGFRTGFAQAAHAAGEGRSEYDAVVGTAVRMQRHYDGCQPGDPAKAAAVVLKLAEMDRPPLRIALGSDAVDLSPRPIAFASKNLSSGARSAYRRIADRPGARVPKRAPCCGSQRKVPGSEYSSA
jgi:hypothetical protein